MDDPDVGDPTPAAVAAASPTAVTAACPTASPPDGSRDFGEGGFTAVAAAAEETPPVASVAPTTPALPISSTTLSQWRQTNMKFRRETLASFEPSDAHGCKAKKKKKNPENPNRGKNAAGPKVTMKFAGAAREKAAAAAAASVSGEAAVEEEPQQVAAIKLKYLGLETKSRRRKYCVE